MFLCKINTVVNSVADLGFLEGVTLGTVLSLPSPPFPPLPSGPIPSLPLPSHPPPSPPISSPPLPLEVKFMFKKGEKIAE